MSPVLRGAAQAATATGGAGKQAANKSVASGKAKARAKKSKTTGAKKIVLKELAPFSRQLAAMLSAGMPIVTSLGALEEQTSNPNFKPIIRAVRSSIEGGSAFSESLKSFPTVFDELYVNMVRGGETGGQLAETVARIATFLEASAKLRRKVKSAMSYPIIVMVIAFCICILMLVFIVPVFAKMFADFNADLPAATQGLVNVSEFLQKNIVWVILFIIPAVVLFKKWKQTPKGALTMDTFYLKIPIIKEIVLKVGVARFARTFAQLIHGGVPILVALDISAGATGNRVLGDAIRSSCETVERGDPLSNALKEKGCFPPMLTHMLSAGEKTGKVDEMMESIADFYEDEVETILGGLTALIEPLLMVFLGVTIGGMVVCMFLPIFKLPSVIQF